MQVLESAIFESNQVSRIANELRVVLRLNVEMSQESTVTLSGLVGTLTPSTPALMVSVSGVNVPAEWVQGAGKLIVTMPQHVPANEAIRIVFTLRNSPGAQQPCIVTADIRPAVENLVLKSTLEGAVLASDALPLFVSTFATEDLKVRGQWNKIVVCRLHVCSKLLVSLAFRLSYPLSTVQETSPVP